MGNFDRSPYGDRTMQIEPYRNGGGGPHDFRSYSASYAQTRVGNAKDIKLKKGKSLSGAKSWGLSDPEIQRKKRVASYKMYSVEGKVKGSLRKSFRWLKQRYTQVVYGWW